MEDDPCKVLSDSYIKLLQEKNAKKTDMRDFKIPMRYLFLGENYGDVKN